MKKIWVPQETLVSVVEIHNLRDGYYRHCTTPVNGAICPKTDPMTALAGPSIGNHRKYQESGWIAEVWMAGW